MSKTNHLDAASQDASSDSDNRIRQMQILSQLIDLELEKPDDELDEDLLTEYQLMLSELMQEEQPCSESDLDAKLETVKQQALSASHGTTVSGQPVSGKKLRRWMLLRFAAVFVAVLIALFATLTVTAKVQGYGSAWEFIVENFRRIRGLSTGDSVNENDITLTKPTGTASYHSMEELIEAEHLPVLYPTNLPDGVRLREIRQWNEENGKMTMMYIFSDSTIQMNLTNYYQASDGNLSSDKVTVQGVDFYISFKSKWNVYHAIGRHGSYEYNIQCQTKEDLLQLLRNLKGF